MARELKKIISDRIRRGGAREFLRDNIEIDTKVFLWSVIVDVNTGCNVDCVFCFISAGARREFAAPELFEKLGEVVLPRACEIAFGCRHEALLHPQFCSAVESLHRVRRRQQSSTFLVLLTSGTLLTPSLSRSLAGCGLDFVLFSIPTTDSDTYSALRRPGSWPELEGKLRGFLEVIQEGKPVVAVQTLIMRSTVPHLVSTLDAVADIGFKRYHINQLVHAPARASDQVVLWSGPHRGELQAVTGALAETGRRRGVEVAHPLPAPEAVEGEIFPLAGDGDVWDEHLLKGKRRVVCCSPWMKLRIDHAGFAYPCPHILDPAHAWGNILRDPFSEIVNGKTATNMRRELLDGRAPNLHCERCPYGFARDAG